MSKARRRYLTGLYYDAGFYGELVYQQFYVVQPDLSCGHPGRHLLPGADRGYEQILCPEQAGFDGAVEYVDQLQIFYRSAAGESFQYLPVGRSGWIDTAGLQQRPEPGRPAEARGKVPPAWLYLRFFGT